MGAIQEATKPPSNVPVVSLSQSRRITPLVFALGAFVMLFQGLRLLLSNWRLTLVQVLPAMWIWIAMLDLKLHVFKGKEFQSWYGWAAVALVAGITLGPRPGFYLNAVFAFAISLPRETGDPLGFTLARSSIWASYWGSGSSSVWHWGSPLNRFLAGVRPGSPSR